MLGDLTDVLEGAPAERPDRLIDLLTSRADPRFAALGTIRRHVADPAPRQPARRRRRAAAVYARPYHRTHVHDLHATILHLLGLNHKKLTFRHNGRNERLTDNGCVVIRKALA